MTFEPTAVNLHCQACRHEWQERIELPMAVKAALARMRGWCTCPNCASDNHVYIGEMKEATVTIKQSLLRTLNEDGPQTLVELNERLGLMPPLGRGAPRARGVQARLWELRHDGKIERDDEGVYTALVKSDDPRGPHLRYG